MSRLRQLQNKAGFTLIEILVVVAIIGILSAVIVTNSSGSGKLSRDAERQADLRALQSAIELYKHKNGRYPEQCLATGALAGGWSGQLNTDFECDDTTNRYILGANGRWFSEFMPTLLVDPKLNGSNSGYVYRTNAAGTVYKLMAMNTVEGENVGYTHEFASCDWNRYGTTGGSSDILVTGWCVNPQWNSNNTPTWCQTSSARYIKSYGVWGGIAPLNSFFVDVSSSTPLAITNNTSKVRAVENTSIVICQ